MEGNHEEGDEDMLGVHTCERHAVMLMVDECILIRGDPPIFPRITHHRSTNILFITDSSTQLPSQTTSRFFRISKRSTSKRIRLYLRRITSRRSCRCFRATSKH